MSPWTIRKAKESDINCLVELFLDLQSHHESRNSELWRLSAQGREQIKDQLAQLLSDEDALVLVSLDNNDKITGMGIGRIRRNDRYIPPVSGSIERLFISEAWRRQGIGTEIVRRICQFFASKHVEDISLHYISGNAEADQFWKKLGFRTRMVLVGTELRELERKLAGES